MRTSGKQALRRCSSTSLPLCRIRSRPYQARTKEGLAVALAKGRFKGKRPKLSALQVAERKKTHAVGDHTITELEASPDQRSIAPSTESQSDASDFWEGHIIGSQGWWKVCV